MTFTQLQYIIAVDNHRHFAKAAEACHVTQPTLSMQIQKLEDELGVILFDRSKHPVRPTVIGERILEQARKAVNEGQRIIQLTQIEKGKFEGEFKIGVIPTVSPQLLPRFLSRFNNKFPGIQLIVEELQTDQCIERLYRDELDVAILATPLDKKNLIEEPLYYEPFVAYIPDGHRLYNEKFVLNSELSLTDMLLLTEGHCFRNSILNLCEARDIEKGKKLRLESGNFETLTRLSKLGYGMTLLPYLAAADLSKEEQQFVRPIADPTPSREISLVYSKSQLKKGLLKELAAIIKSVIPEKLQHEKEQVLKPM
ncbi:MAG: hydrogen peroxide-inducible genes activator [Schleiferiaceae bacterium]|nr:hydrogen peroxide-inducible genes activator [Schleiferiaceae bacterium]